MEERDFAYALRLLKRSGRLTRDGWNGKGMWIELMKPDSRGAMSAPYIYMKTADNKKVPWVASHTDLLATDWMPVAVVSDTSVPGL